MAAYRCVSLRPPRSRRARPLNSDLLRARNHTRTPSRLATQCRSRGLVRLGWARAHSSARRDTVATGQDPPISRSLIPAPIRQIQTRAFEPADPFLAKSPAGGCPCVRSSFGLAKPSGGNLELGFAPDVRPYVGVSGSVVDRPSFLSARYALHARILSGGTLGTASTPLAAEARSWNVLSVGPLAPCIHLSVREPSTLTPLPSSCNLLKL